MTMKNYKRRSQLKHVKNQVKKIKQKIVNELRFKGVLQKPEVEINQKPILPEKL